MVNELDSTNFENLKVESDLKKQLFQKTVQKNGIKASIYLQ